MSENKPKQIGKRKAPSTAFKPGQSGNPGGRPRVVADIQALARAHTPEAIQALVEALSDPRSKVAAATALLDRGYGRPAQHQILTGVDGGPIQTQQVDDARPPIEQFLAEFGGAAKGETKH